ncbi:hypothetical protein B0H13DRAFT_2367117 [Mycena leptocephala]|nr:hypothetical protein B0H13DRAFT_2367117 [Mycena leptocephala]
MRFASMLVALVFCVMHVHRVASRAASVEARFAVNSNEVDKRERKGYDILEVDKRERKGQDILEVDKRERKGYDILEVGKRERKGCDITEADEVNERAVLEA